jgi:hypothetical protein
MKVLVQDKHTKKYLTAEGSWTAKADDAEDFLFTARAYDIAVSRVRGPFRVVFHSSSLGYSINILDGNGQAVETVTAQAA